MTTTSPTLKPTPKEMIHKILDNRPAMIGIMLCAAAAAVVTIAGGFLVVYKILTVLGN